MLHSFLYLKNNHPIIWKFIEFVNGKIFNFLYLKRFTAVNSHLLNSQELPPFTFRKLKEEDLEQITILIANLEPVQGAYFEPHLFDLKSLRRVFKNPSFIMMGVFLNSQLVGYFLLRCFINKKCFVGRLVDKEYRGKDIGKKMNEILYHSAWDSGFRCFATISKENDLVLKAHTGNPSMFVMHELDDNYLLVEFVEPLLTTEQND